jgi:hypothetical protein
MALKVIIRDYPLLRADLAALISDRSIPLVLINVMSWARV